MTTGDEVINMSKEFVYEAYEGNEPYLFISYSHKDSRSLAAVINVLKTNNVRYWFDNGLHSGDDWNLVIAKHLMGAAACLLLLSPNSAESEYVKNELNFAMNHRIPIHTLLIKQFVLPLDIEMMTGRIQMVDMTSDYQQKLIKALPHEVFGVYHCTTTVDNTVISHCLFEIKKLLGERQGTQVLLGTHKKLGYNCAILKEVIQSDESESTEKRLTFFGGLNDRLFPQLYDFDINGDNLIVYQEYEGITYLDDYLSTNSLNENEIISWIVSVIEGVSRLFNKGLVFRDFARGSIVVTDEKKINFIRPYHPYYGVIKYQLNTKQYYFENSLQEISILLAQLCLGHEPMLPIRIITDKRFSKHFLEKVNLVIQKCARENGTVQYRGFDELLSDLNRDSFSMKEKKFLKDRTKKLYDYDKEKERRSNSFVADDRNPIDLKPIGNLEEKFGFDETVILQDDSNEQETSIRIKMCSTGQILNFTKKEIFIGKDKVYCDMVWTQPYVSRMHLKIIDNEDETYTVVDCNSTNGTYIAKIEAGELSWDRIPAGKSSIVSHGVMIRVGLSEISIL